MKRTEIEANARKPYADRLAHIAAAVERLDRHEAIDERYREGWHAAIAAVRLSLTQRVPD